MGRSVWSSKEVQKFARLYVPVAGNVGHLQHGDDKGSRFFQTFVENVPARKMKKVKRNDSTHPIRQGIYLMSPNGRYLGAAFAKYTPAKIKRALKEGWKKWRKLARKHNVTPEPIKPLSERDHLMSVDGGRMASPADGRLNGNAALVLHVHSRDLPGHAPAPSRKNREGDWNQQWFELAEREVQALLPSGSGVHRVPDSLVRAIGKKSFIDNVRGQTKEWTDNQVKEAKLVAKPMGRENGVLKVRYRGTFEARAGNRSVDLKIYGNVLWNTEEQAFERIGIVAAGVRTGWTQHNGRKPEGPSPIGFSLTLEGPYNRK